MKKLMALLLVGMLLVAGCQATPEKEVIVQKDLEHMLSSAQKETEQESASGEMSLAEQYGIPSEYTWEAQGADGKFNVSVDAPIIVPQSGKLPIYRVQAADFSQEIVSAFWNEFIGDTEMWNEVRVRTKGQIMEDILYLKELMTDEKRLKEQTLYTPDEAREEIARLEEQYQTAPEATEETRADDILDEMFIYENDAEQSGRKLTSFMGIRAHEQFGAKGYGGKVFSVSNNFDLAEVIIVEKDEQGRATHALLPMRSAGINFFDDRNSDSARFDNNSAIPIDSELDPSIIEYVGITPSEAIDMVQAILDKTNSGMMAHRVFLVTSREELGGEATDYAYNIQCARQVNGVPVAMILGGSEVGDAADPEAMSATWSYENMTFEISKNGIYFMQWWSPLEITETLNEDSQLKPFSEIQEIFEKMILVKYEDQAARPSVQSKRIEIDRVELSLQRIAEQNSYENGLLVPVWNFYGNDTVKLEDGYEYTRASESMLSINAIDGSIIDTAKGY